MSETSVIFVGENGWTDMAPDLPTERVTTAHAFHQPWWKGVTLYHRNGYKYEVEKATPEEELPALSKILAATIHNPSVNVQYEFSSSGFYQLEELKKALHDAVCKDDDVLTQFHDADELCALIAKADTFDDLVEMLVYAASDVIDI